MKNNTKKKYAYYNKAEQRLDEPLPFKDPAAAASLEARMKKVGKKMCNHWYVHAWDKTSRNGYLRALLFLISTRGRILGCLEVPGSVALLSPIPSSEFMASSPSLATTYTIICIKQ
jgi:hypothetical protein